jgi:hypothetical protein
MAEEKSGFMNFMDWAGEARGRAYDPFYEERREQFQQQNKQRERQSYLENAQYWGSQVAQRVVSGALSEQEGEALMTRAAQHAPGLASSPLSKDLPVIAYKNQLRLLREGEQELLFNKEEKLLGTFGDAKNVPEQMRRPIVERRAERAGLFPPSMTEEQVAEENQRMGGPLSMEGPPDIRRATSDTNKQLADNFFTRAADPRYSLSVLQTGNQFGQPAGTIAQMGPDGKMSFTSPEKGSGMSTEDRTAQANVLRKEFNASPAVKDWQTIRRATQGVIDAFDTSVAGGSRIASDQALGVLFQKVLDPQSVVRESEYARTPEGAAMLNRLLAYADKIQRGGLTLTDGDRKAIRDMVVKLATGAAKSYNEQVGQMKTYAEHWGIDPVGILGGLDTIDSATYFQTKAERQAEAPKGKSPAIKVGTTITNPKTGEKRRWDGQTWQTI